MKYISVEYLKEAFKYNSETGVIHWKKRPKSHFETEEGWRASNARFAGLEAGSVDSHGYLQIGIAGRLYMAHRIAWALHHNEWPVYEIDHISGIKADNRIQNLRMVTLQVNCKNKRIYSSNKTGASGVVWYKSRGKWRARINVDGKMKHLGYFDDFGEAVRVRREAESQFQYHENHAKRTGSSF